MEESTEAPEGLLLPNRPPRIQSPTLLNPRRCQTLHLSIVCPSTQSYRPQLPHSGALAHPCVFTCGPNIQGVPTVNVQLHMDPMWKREEKEFSSLSLLLHMAGTLRHTTPGQSFSSPLPLSALITVKNSQRRKKSKWKEPAYLSFPIVYLFHGKLIFSSRVTGSSLDWTARPVWLWPPLPSPSPRFMARLWGGLLSLSTRKSFR